MSKTLRYHFSVPESDRQITEWIEQQHSLSTTLRIVIKDFIARHGMIDASCMALSLGNADFETKPAEVAKPAEPIKQTEDKPEQPAVNDMLADLMK